MCISSNAQISISIDFYQEDFFFSQTKNGISIGCVTSNYITEGGQSEPRLPYFCYRIILPPDVSDSISFTENHSSELKFSNIKVIANTKPAPRNRLGLDGQFIRTASESVLSPIRYEGIHTIDNIKYAYIKVTPFTYNSISGNLYFVPNITITINISEQNSLRPIDLKRNDSKVIDAYLRNRFVNPDNYYTFYPDVTKDTNYSENKVKNRLENGTIVSRCNYITDYLVITTNNLKLGFRYLASWKDMKGLRTAVITIEDLESYYQTTVTPAVIKQFLNDIHLYSTGINKKYLVLGGDIDDVPTAYYNQNAYSDLDQTPADIYYACPNLPIAFEDSLDCSLLEPQLYVSRISVKTPLEARNYSLKIKDYEQGATDGEEMLITGYKINGYINGYSDAYYCNERIYNDFIQNNWSGNVMKLYDSGSSVIINSTNLFNYINNGYGLILENSHGVYNSWCIGDVPSQYYGTDFASNQTNYPGNVTITGACETNAFDKSSDCLSEAFTKNPNGGAVAYFGSSRLAYGAETVYPDYNTSPSEFSDLYNGRFLQHLFNGDIPYSPYCFGAIAAQSKKDLIDLARNGSNKMFYRDLQCSINCIGDPEMQIYTDTPQELPENDMPYISYNTPYPNDITVSVYTDCILYFKCEENHTASVVPLQAYQYASFYTPSISKLTVIKKNCIPKLITIFSEGPNESLILNSFQNSDNSIVINILSQDNKCPVKTSDTWTLNVYNALTGKCVYVKTVDGIKAIIDTSRWPKGIYTMKGYINHQVLTGKISLK